MKQIISKDKALRLVNCGMVIMVTAAYKDKVTITPCAWHMPISKSPSVLGVALAKGHFSSELIPQSQEFIVNVPDWSLLDKMMICGAGSGRNRDKFNESGFSPQKAHSLVKTPIIKECVGNIECSLVSVKDVGDHFLFIGEVIAAQAQEEYFINDIWDTNKLDFIFHLGGGYFFKSCGYKAYK